ncbi:hypothetical protein CC1G_09759 [Coprinopsis cinerea okayama7|uniref:Nucleoplasmin-like domain-containing protein n=1 Tax=Coprinopsis cinerea (strain Okayama-7 / 130 / ATCC MYA-4618 / FGSC 9003) TaxID=240176 RepID=A8PE21_COPC7|nr:hypothetical protein CC1G_09759 [Coprinopsis cinerea okayama7\|eukprot:XP_001840708.1 hypothetical protein CC1G_09759 [Coprinopsis cinerea okayama7\
MSHRACWTKRLAPNQLTTVIATHRIQIQSVSLTREADSTRTSLIFRFPMPSGEVGEAVVANVVRYLEDQFPLNIDLEPPNTYSFLVDGPNTLDLFGSYDTSMKATVPEPPQKAKGKGKGKAKVQSTEVAESDTVPPSTKGKGKAQAPTPAASAAAKLEATDSVASVKSSETATGTKKRTRATLKK